VKWQASEMAGHKEHIIYIKFCFNPEKTAFERHKKTLQDSSSEELKPVNSIHVS
jgi:hypothetical protein